MHFDQGEDLQNFKSRSLSRRQSERSLHGHTAFIPRKHKQFKQTSSEKAFYIIQSKIYIFTATSNFQQIINELNNISESISRPQHINQFQVTEGSLLRAKALGYTQQKVLQFLKKNMRNNNQVPQTIRSMIQISLGSQSRVRLYLHQGKQKNFYFFEINQLQFQNISPSVRQKLKSIIQQVQQKMEQEANMELEQQIKLLRFKVKPFEHNHLSMILFEAKIPLSSEKTIQKSQHIQQLKKKTDFIRNKEALHCKDLKITLKAFTKLRDYQSEALRSVVSLSKDGKLTAKSGYIILPCGAGKTLLGISICTKIKKQTLIVCSSDSGADQWKRQIEKWTQGLHRDQIIILTSKTMAEFQFNIKDTKPHIYISTYTNLKSKFQPKEGQMKMENQWLKLMPWGLILFDQAQWYPAPGNKQIANSLQAHVKIGLTATPLRQDNNIQALIYMIGPQIYVGSWKKFVQQGFLANPKCLQIRTKMTPKFAEMYKSTPSSNTETQKMRQRQILYETNPNKVKALIYLLQYHQSLNDNIIVFCDNIGLINFLAYALKRPLLTGKTPNEDRNFVFDMFRDRVFKTIFLTRIGDEAIDLPNANVAIQVVMHKGSRRQMMQRLGRIMRPKQASSSQSYNAIFYTIVSQGTLQMKYFGKRRNYLVDLGFQYDLRLFEYPNQGTIQDIYQQDEQKQKIVQQKFLKILPDQYRYYQALMQARNQKQ